MKLAEALMEREALEQRLETLESRLKDDSTPTRHKRPMLEEIRSVATQVRDLNIAIDWTESLNSLLQLPISGHRHKIRTNFNLARIFEKTDPDEADDLWRSAVDDSKVVEAATWLVDLQVPGVGTGSGQSQKEVD